jgi:hypothetical protein
MFQDKMGKGFTNRPAAMRSDRMSEQQKPMQEKPNSGQHKTVSIHHDGDKFHVEGGGSHSKMHDDIESALNHARSIFGGHEAGSEDTAMEASGEGAAL